MQDFFCAGGVIPGDNSDWVTERTDTSLWPSKSTEKALTMTAVGAFPAAEGTVLEAAPKRLEDFARAVGNSSQAEGLALLRRWLSEDLKSVEAILLESTSHRAQAVARPLLEAGGKRIRPLCLLAASRLGTSEPGVDALQLAAVVEYIHNATLLHDDVVDLADERRGQTTARVTHGNTVSVFAGDWLLIRALRLIHGVGYPWALPAALDCIDQLIEAEILQAELSLSLKECTESYLQVIDGKTASLFRLALGYGAYLAGLDDAQRNELMSFATHLGVAFQVQDDLLDLVGDPDRTGKPLLSDLAEGKLTLPLLWLLEHHPEQRVLVAALAHQPVANMNPSHTKQLRQALDSSGGLRAAQDMVQARLAQAHDCLESLPDSLARSSLSLMTQLLVERTS